MANPTNLTRPTAPWWAGLTIWIFALGYCVAYVPYSALTKALTSGRIADTRVGGFELLPPSVAASVVGMLLLITLLGWWRHASTFQVCTLRLPRPGRWTLLSGLCTGLIVVTTTLAYTIDGVSIVFAMLLMRGGVLIMSPVVDTLSGRRVRWFSWMGLLMSFGALIVAFAAPAPPGTSRFAFNLLLALDIGVYLASYFVRLRFMTKLAKSDDGNATRRYFVEEQMVATPSVLLLLAILAVIGGNDSFLELREGFSSFWSKPILFHGLAVGVCSQFTGVFGALVLLDKSENAFAVPVNRCSSVLAGVFATYTLHLLLGMKLPSTFDLMGAGMIVGAILFLTIPPMLEKRRAAARVQGVAS